MAKQPTGAGYIPTQQPDGASGLTANKPDTAAAHPQPAPPPPVCSESKSFCPAENKPGDSETSKVYGTFKNAAPAAAAPGSVAANSAFRKDSAGSAAVAPAVPSRGGGSGQCSDPLRGAGAAAEQNNAPGNLTTMSQTTIILGTDGNTSVQPGTVVGVSQLNEPSP